MLQEPDNPFLLLLPATFAICTCHSADSNKLGKPMMECRWGASCINRHQAPHLITHRWVYVTWTSCVAAHPDLTVLYVSCSSSPTPPPFPTWSQPWCCPCCATTLLACLSLMKLARGPHCAGNHENPVCVDCGPGAVVHTTRPWASGREVGQLLLPAACRVSNPANH